MTEAKTYTPEEARDLLIATTRRRGDKAVTCPHCGHPVYPDEIRESLAGKQRSIYEVVARAGTLGISTSEICEIVYAEDPKGIPSWNTIAANVRIINRRIAKWGLRVGSSRGWGMSCYRLYPLERADES